MLTDDAADVVPDGDLVGDDGAPVEGAAQIERQPEEEGVVDELQAGVRQRVLQRNKRRVLAHHPSEAGQQRERTLLIRVYEDKQLLIPVSRKKNVRLFFFTMSSSTSNFNYRV